MRYQLVIFDLDGTLLDTLADISGAANAVLAEFGAPTHPPAAYRQFIGDGVATLFQRALPASASDPDLNARCVAGFQTAYGRGWANQSAPYGGINELLDTLEQHGVKLAVLSNKPHEFTQLVMRHFFPNSPFHPILGQRAEVPKKPDPAGVHEILQTLAIPADECCYLGDSSVDMETARRAGVLAVGATWGFRSAEELQAYGADVLLDHPLELLPVVI